MMPTMKYKDRQIRLNSSNPCKRKAVAKNNVTHRSQYITSSTEDDEAENSSSNNLPIASSTLLKTVDYKRNYTKHIFVKSQKKQACDIQSNNASSYSSNDDDLRYSSPIFTKRKLESSSEVICRKRKSNTLPIVNSEEASNDNNDRCHTSEEPIIIDVENTNQNHSPEFKACLAQVLGNITKILSSYESRLSHLKKKYCDSESTEQDDMDNVMFILGCIMNRLKDDLDKEEKSLNMTYSSQKQLQPPCGVTKRNEDQTFDRLRVKVNEVIVLDDDDTDDTIPPKVQEKLTLPEASKDPKQLEIPNVTIKHTQSQKNENPSIYKAVSKEKEKDADASTNNVTDKLLPSLSHLTEITIENSFKRSNNIDSNFDCKKPSTILNPIQQGSGDIVPRRQKSGYDSDISTCSTIICRKPPRPDSTSGTNKHLTSQRYGSIKSEILTKSITTPKKRRKEYITSDLDSDSTELEGDEYPLQSRSKKCNRDYVLPSSKKTEVPKNTIPSLPYSGSQIFRRTSPVLVLVDTINNPDSICSEDEIDATNLECYIAEKHKKNLIQNDIKLQMNCVVELSKLD